MALTSTAGRRRGRKIGTAAAAIALAALMVVGGGRLLPGKAIGATLTERTPVLIDSDGGLDDLTALLMARQISCLDVRGITASFGVVPLPQAARNLLSAADWMERDWPVALGAGASLDGRLLTREEQWGETGLCGVALPPSGRSFDARTASDFLYDLAVEEGGRLQVVCLGPLTNLAAALREHPDLAGRIAGVTLGAGLPLPEGGLDEEGESAYWAAVAGSDYALQADPTALREVVESGIPLTVVPAPVQAEMAAVRQRDRDTISPLFQDLRETKPVYGQMLSFLKEQGGTSDRVSLELGGVAVLAALTDESAFSFLPANLQWRQGALAYAPAEGEGDCRVAAALTAVTDEKYRRVSASGAGELIPVPQLYGTLEQTFRYW